MSKTLEEILKMDVKDEEFFEIYKKISTKYWTFENPDDLQKCASLMVEWAEKFDEEKIILATKIIVEVSKMVTEKTKAATMCLQFTDTQYYVDIAESEVEKDKLSKKTRDIYTAIKKGKLQDKYGKDYFK